MNSDEKQLIENLFSRLYKTEIKSSNRDDIAEKLIKDLLEKYPNSPYYMAQTILIQETAIKKLNEKISVLNNNLEKNKQDDKSASGGGFLSNLFGTKKHQVASKEHMYSNENKPNNTVRDSNFGSFPSQTRSNTIPQSGTINNTSGFLSGALQTAAGVAGGVVMANMLMNLFQNKKPEEDVIDAVHDVDASHIEPNIIDSDPIHNQYVSEDTTYFDNNVENFHQTDYNEICDNDDCNTFEDDNFI
ncbi:DUF2076 domain-containing protein [Buchnera aphidicola]|nr:DUF2076 family protein [Buchnera aphidicola]